LPECLLVDVGLSGRLLDGARLLGAASELLAKELLRALAALGWLRDRGRGHGFAAGCLPLRFRDLGACLRDGAAANLGELREVGRRGVGIGLERGERPIARLCGGAAIVFAPARGAPRALARSWPAGGSRRRL